jgi:DNA-binding NarL/FixJ family response regulator
VRQVWVAGKGLGVHFSLGPDGRWLDDKGKGLELVAWVNECVEAARVIRERHPETGIILLSAYDDDEFVRDFLADPKGKAYLLKQHLTKLTDLVQAVRDVRDGKTVLAPSIVSKLAGGGQNAESGFLAEMTDREREVLACMARGLNNTAIAEELFIQPRTVERHIGSIFSKLRLQQQPDAHARVNAVLAFLKETGKLKEQ